MRHAHEEMSPAEQDLRTLMLNSSSTVKILASMDAAQKAANPRPPNSGFRDAGEFLAALHRQKVDRFPDPRLVTNAATTWAGSSASASGGFALPPEYVNEVLTPIIGDGSILGAFQPTPTQSDLLRVAVGSDAEWASTGITATQLAEGEQITPTKAGLRLVEVPLYRAPALEHVSGELIGRSPAYQRFVWRELARKLRNKIEAYVVQGSGAGQPLGLINAPCVVTVAETTSTATAISKEDVSSMVARLLPGSFPTAIWIAHSTALPALQMLAPGLYNPDGRGPYGTLAGRPLYVSEHAAPLNSTGDVILCDPQCYLWAFDGVYSDATIEFAFDQDLSSFRSSMWVGGAPLIAEPVARRTGTATMSCCVVLAGGRT